MFSKLFKKTTYAVLGGKENKGECATSLKLFTSENEAVNYGRSLFKQGYDYYDIKTFVK